MKKNIYSSVCFLFLLFIFCFIYPKMIFANCTGIIYTYRDCNGSAGQAVCLQNGCTWDSNTTYHNGLICYSTIVETYCSSITTQSACNAVNNGLNKNVQGGSCSWSNPQPTPTNTPIPTPTIEPTATTVLTPTPTGTQGTSGETALTCTQAAFTDNFSSLNSTKWATNAYPTTAQSTAVVSNGKLTASETTVGTDYRFNGLTYLNQLGGNFIIEADLTVINATNIEFGHTELDIYDAVNNSVNAGVEKTSNGQYDVYAWHNNNGNGGGIGNNVSIPNGGPVRVRIQKSGNVFTFYYKNTSGDFVSFASITRDFPSTFYLAIGSSSNGPGYPMTSSEIDNFALSCPALAKADGDADGDGKVCLSDYAWLQKAFNGGFGTDTTNKLRADFNGNNSIDDADMTIWRNNYSPANCGQSF